VAGPLPVGEKWPQSNRLEPQVKRDSSFHAYVHVPFCTVRCGYCDFNTYTQQEMPAVSLSTFHSPIIQEIEFSKKVLSESELPQPALNSVFFGGGTPSLFSSRQTSEILDALFGAFGRQNNCEITLEANPESTSFQLLEELRDAGVNRISFGVQSFDERVLQVLDRQHDPATVPNLISEAKRLGFSTSIDLIYGSPHEDLESWKRTVALSVALGTEHISAYSLIVEDGTKLARQIKQGELPNVDEDLNAEKYEYATEAFSQAGLEWYEVSNFGVEAKHNLAYWQSQNWWGYGPGAHSHISGNRFWNLKHPAKYSQQLAHGSAAAGIERLTKRQMLEEQLMLGLRTKYGIERELLSRLKIDPARVARQIALGNLTVAKDRVLPTKPGRLLIDRLVVDFLQ
jgi:putative oxygen-independent coproporphyrinogen III oxidase